MDAGLKHRIFIAVTDNTDQLNANHPKSPGASHVYPDSSTRHIGKTEMLSIQSTSLASLLALSLCSFPIVALAQESPLGVSGLPEMAQPLARSVPLSSPGKSSTPPNPGLPGRRQPASPRGPCSLSEKPLTALIPQTNLGLTISPYPSFFFYVPQTSARTVEFVLLDEENNTKVYETTFTITGKPGIISVKLPSSKTVQPLTARKNYHWYFSMVCDSEDRAGDLYVDGWVERLDASPTLTRELEKAAPHDQGAFYQKYELWHEILTSLAEGRRLKPHDSALASEWANQLRAVGLGAIAQEPLIQP